MSLSAGDKLGSYEVLALIGAARMGEVYKALDTKLDREVAINVLPVAFASHPERLPRFEPEAEQILLQIAGALEYAHEHGIVHRDLKPGNTKIDSEAESKALKSFPSEGDAHVIQISRRGNGCGDSRLLSGCAENRF